MAGTSVTDFAPRTTLAHAGEGGGEPIPVTPVVRSKRDAADAPRPAESPKSGDIIHRIFALPEPESRYYHPYLGYLTLGVVFGDIGTSPLYTMSAVFVSPPNSNDDILGVVSLMIWSLILMVALKYLTFVVMADDHGEGGTFAIYALMTRHLKRKIKDPVMYDRINFVLATLALVGVACVLADGVLTPAITILGAVQGLSIVNPAISNQVCVGVSCALLFLLFAVQSFGTTRISTVNSPFMTLWFLSLLGMGIYNITLNPWILGGLSPHYGFLYLINYQYNGFVALGSVFLTITGTEAMYADLGHFSRRGMRLSGLCFVIPCLIICYLGQASALANNYGISGNIFFSGIPATATVYFLVIAIIAAVIASQAMISASFSITSQAIKLGCFPQIEVRHTSESGSFTSSRSLPH